MSHHFFGTRDKYCTQLHTQSFHSSPASALCSQCTAQCTYCTTEPYPYTQNRNESHGGENANVIAKSFEYLQRLADVFRFRNFHFISIRNHSIFVSQYIFSSFWAHHLHMTHENVRFSIFHRIIIIIVPYWLYIKFGYCLYTTRTETHWMRMWVCVVCERIFFSWKILIGLSAAHANCLDEY